MLLPVVPRTLEQFYILMSTYMLYDTFIALWEYKQVHSSQHILAHCGCANKDIRVSSSHGRGAPPATGPGSMGTL